MFVQVFQGPVSDAGQVRAQMDRWVAELAPDAEGWLGSTSGVTADNTFVALARFESQEAARRNSERPEQGAWWQQTAALFTAEPTFHDSTAVDVDTPGDPAAAGFVQVMQGRSSNPERGRELMAGDPDLWREFRPDILGTVSVGHQGGEWTMAIYFASEAAAREGEQKQPPPQIQAVMEELESLSVGQPRFYDLTDPWLHSPA